MSKYFLYLTFYLISYPLYALTELQVTQSSDNNPGGFGQPGELRWAINTMNEQLNAESLDDYQISFAMPMTIQLNGLLPIINNSSNPVNITIGNPGSLITVIIDGNNGLYSGFFIPIGTVTIQNMAFQNMTAKGGDGGDGMSGGGGGLGAGAAIYAPQTFLNGSSPTVTLMNVSVRSCSAIGGNGGSYFRLTATGNEGGAGGGGFSGNGGSILTSGITGGAGGGGFGGNGGNVTLNYDNEGGGGGGGGGIGSRANSEPFENLGNGGSDQEGGLSGNAYGLASIIAGAGGGGFLGGNRAGGGGSGGITNLTTLIFGGGGGGSNGLEGKPAIGAIPASQLKKERHGISFKLVEAALPSGGNGGDGAGGGGAGIVTVGTSSNGYDGAAGNGGYGGGGGGGAGPGAYDNNYTVKAGSGGMGGGGGVNQSGLTSADGGNSLGGGGGGGGGPSEGFNASGGVDIGHLGGGAGGQGAQTYGSAYGGGGGGGGSALGAAIFIDSGLNFIIQAIPNVPTTFNTVNNTTTAGAGGAGGPDGSSGSDGTALGNSIFLRTGSTLNFIASNNNDILILGEEVSFVDDTDFVEEGGTQVFVNGNGTVIYNGITDYQGSITINNANFKVNNQINRAKINVCRKIDLGEQRGVLSGRGQLTGQVLVNSGTISPDPGQTLTLGSLTLNSANSTIGTIGSLTHIDINSNGSSLIAVAGATSLAGTLEINLDTSTQPGEYTLLTSHEGVTGAFDKVTFTTNTPNYTIVYGPTSVKLKLIGFVDIPATVNGSPVWNPAVVCCGRPVILGSLPVPGSGPTVYRITNKTGNVRCNIGQTSTQTYLKMYGKKGSCTVVGTKDGVTSNPLTVVAS